MHLVLLAAAGDDLDPVQRRHRGVNASGREHRPHVAVEEGEQQRPDVRAVDVGVGHDDDLAVAHGVGVERAPRPGAQHLDERGALAVLEHVADRRLLDIEDLSADRQQRLELDRPGQLGGAQRAVTLDDEQLGALDVVAAAVGELGRQRGRLEGVLAALQLLGLAGGDTRARSADHLLEDRRAPWSCRPRLVDVSTLVSSRCTTCDTMRVAADVPSTSLVWPSNWGSASRTHTTPVSPSSTSSLTTGSSLAFNSLAARSCSLTVRTSPRSKPETCVPPFGVAMMLTKLRTVVS